MEATLSASVEEVGGTSVPSEDTEGLSDARASAGSGLPCAGAGDAALSESAFSA